MRRRLASETDNTISLVVDDQEQELYKDKVAQPVQNIANRFYNFSNTIYTKSESFLSTSLLGTASQSTTAPPAAQNLAGSASDDAYDLLINSEPEIEFVMTARDRSSEFSNTIRSLQGRNINRAVNIRDPKKVKQIQNYGEFMMVAKTIGKNIASTYAKLEKLTLCELAESIIVITVVLILSYEFFFMF